MQITQSMVVRSPVILALTGVKIEFYLWSVNTAKKAFSIHLNENLTLLYPGQAVMQIFIQ